MAEPARLATWGGAAVAGLTILAGLWAGVVMLSDHRADHRWLGQRRGEIEKHEAAHARLEEMLVSRGREIASMQQALFMLNAVLQERGLPADVSPRAVSDPGDLPAAR